MNDRKHLSGREFERLLEAVKGSRNEIRDRCLVLLMFRHGLRVSEACSLVLEQVDIESRVLHVARLKSGLSTTHPLRGDEIRAIKAWLVERSRMKAPGRSFFLSEQRKPLHRSTVNLALRKYGEKAKLPVAVHPHHHPATLLHLAALLLSPAALLAPPSILLGAAAPALSQPSPAVVPARERVEGAPEATTTQGVLAVKRLGGQPLGPEFAALGGLELRGRELRLREITVAPGGTIALHRHDRRPGIAYILEGQMTERRGPGFTPKVFGPGQVAFEGDGITHWWRNEGTTPARALVVDIVPIQTP